MAEHQKTSQKNQEEVDQKHRVRRQDSQPLFDQVHAWEQGTLTISETPFQPRMDEHGELLSMANSDEQVAGLMMHLQQTYGNQYVQRLLTSKSVQAKLTVSDPNDVYEQEADRVAEAVTRATTSQVQRQEVPEEEEVMTKPASEIQRQEEEEEVQAQSTEGHPITVPDTLETRMNKARSIAHPLSEVIREPMEQAFGADFSGVRVHTDSEADALNQQLSARAFTTGQDIFFRQFEYSPNSDSGKKLIAHELTHVVQQSTGQVRVQRWSLSFAVKISRHKSGETCHQAVYRWLKSAGYITGRVDISSRTPDDATADFFPAGIG